MRSLGKRSMMRSVSLLEEKRDQFSFALCPPYEDTMRRRLSASQEVDPYQKVNLLAP